MSERDQAGHGVEVDPEKIEILHRVWELQKRVDELEAELAEWKSGAISRSYDEIRSDKGSECDHDWEDIGKGRQQCTYQDCQKIEVIE